MAEEEDGGERPKSWLCIYYFIIRCNRMDYGYGFMKNVHKNDEVGG